METWRRYADAEGQELTVNEMIDFGRQMTPGKLIKSARHLHHELPVRIARRIVDFQDQPYIVVSNESFNEEYTKYNDAFDRLRQFPKITCMEDELKFTKLVEALVAEHISVIPTLGRGLKEVQGYLLEPMQCHRMDKFMDRLLMTRISRRVLAEQHLAFHRPRPGYIGVVCLEYAPHAVLRAVSEKAAAICDRTYGYHPEVVVEGHTDAVVSYIPVHLEYILLELIKNAMRATVEFAWSTAAADRGDLSPIAVTISESAKFITIRVCDRGGGIDPDSESAVWTYGFTSVQTDEDAGGGATGMLGTGGGPDPAYDSDPIAGLGFGLPLSKTYAKYFGGDLRILSMHGLGTDVYLRLPRVGDVREQLVDTGSWAGP